MIIGKVRDRDVDIVSGLRYRLTIEGVLVSGFSRVSGLTAEIETQEIEEAGNASKIKLIGNIRYPPLVLEKGVTIYPYLWQWFKCMSRQALGRTTKFSFNEQIRRTIWISLLSRDGRKVIRNWIVYGAFPVSIEAPELNAMSSAPAIEKVTLMHSGFDMD